jgi:uncharacterized protein
MDSLNVHVGYARPNAQFLRAVAVPPGTTLHAAVRLSGILQDAPEIDLSTCRVGIPGKLKELDTVLREGDRVEIYRPLIADPKDSRRRRAEKKA